MLRRVGLKRSAPPTNGDVQLDAEQQTVRVEDGGPVRLTNVEFRLLQYLLANAEHTAPFDRLTNHVWDYRGVGDRQLLKQLVHRLRQKIERNPAEPRYIVTVPNVGYMLHASAQHE